MLETNSANSSLVISRESMEKEEGVRATSRGVSESYHVGSHVAWYLRQSASAVSSSAGVLPAVKTTGPLSLGLALAAATRALL